MNIPAELFLIEGKPPSDWLREQRSKAAAARANTERAEGMGAIDPSTLEPLFKRPEKGNNPPSFSHAALIAMIHRIGETKRIARKNNPQGHVPNLNKSQAEESWDEEIETSLQYVV